MSIAETGAITFSVHLAAQSDVLRALTRHPTIVGICARPRRSRREPLLGPGRVQEAGEAPPVPVAPGQRLRVRRAAAVPHGLARPHRRHRRQRLPVGRARPAPARHAAAHLRRPARLRVPVRARRARWPPRCPPAARSCSRRSPRTSPGPNTTDAVRKAYILQYAPAGAEVLRGDPTRGRRSAASRPTRPTASTRCCAAARRADPTARRDLLRRARPLPSAAVATDPPADLMLAPINGEPRTHRRVAHHLPARRRRARPVHERELLAPRDGRPGAHPLHRRRLPRRLRRHRHGRRGPQFLGPWADRVLTFADPDRAAVKALGLNELPAFVHIRGDRKVVGAAEGWDPLEWRDVAEGLAKQRAGPPRSSPRPATRRPTPAPPPPAEQPASAAAGEAGAGRGPRRARLVEQALLEHQLADRAAGRGGLLHELGDLVVAEEPVERGGRLRRWPRRRRGSARRRPRCRRCSGRRTGGSPWRAAGSTRAGCGPSPAGRR